MSSKKHMDYDDLLLLYKYISLNYSAKKITQLLKKDRSTIYRIIISNSRIENERTYSIRFKNCEHLLKCKKDGINNCPVSCPNFKKWICPNLKKFPYICNFCESRYSCRKEKRLFNPEEAYISRMDRFSESKKCPKISHKELSNFDEIISPLIKEGLSIESIESSLKECFPATTRTVRNWINKGYLSAKRIDLRNAVKREYSPSYIYKRPSKDPLLKVGRTWTSFLKYMETEDKQDVIQFDTVHGKKSDKKCA